ncbi:MAG TPA: GNAT family N-acetyltransferase [Anaeromyxobacter sp.]|nr:GNAT family N-acetyltransferase [Anaeromyxobacter sp.]
MHIRPLRSSDASDVARLAGQLGYPATRSEVEARLRAVEERSEHLCLGAEDGEGRLIGWVEAASRELLYVDRYAEICALVVDEACRGGGVGRALLEAAERWAGELGHRVVRLRSSVKRERTHRLYLRLGYVVEGTGHTFRKDRPPTGRR